MGRPELQTDPRYATQIERCQRRPEIRRYIEDWLQTFEDDETPLRILAEARVPSAPILDIPQVPEHQQIKARQLFQAGSPVRVSTVGGGFEISTEGQALGSGQLGQHVQVKLQNGKIITGAVTGEGSVVVRQ
jgi:crotonobetainyl-CoA:carnitine CoA-transferase CaiB-like acyl-CoA transferase